MLQYLVRKIFHTLFVALGVVTLVFVALRLSGDPAATMLPGDASVDGAGALHARPEEAQGATASAGACPSSRARTIA